MVISEAVRNAEKSLKENARFEAELIVMSVLCISREQFILCGGNVITDEQQRLIEEYTARRKCGEPLQYILGECEFMSLGFYVEKGVLIPRSDTETLAEAALEAAEDGMRIIDICSGSGCIGISLAHYRKKVEVELVDISDKAIEIANKNIIRNNVADRVKTKKLDILNEYPSKKYDMAVSNPPYIKTEIIETLQTEVKDHEPRIALDGGADGLLFYRRIIDIADRFIKKGGMLMLEIGFDQGQDVKCLMEEKFDDICIIKDLCHNDRVVTGILK